MFCSELYWCGSMVSYTSVTAPTTLAQTNVKPVLILER
jgi:hypothetical protein